MSELPPKARLRARLTRRLIVVADCAQRINDVLGEGSSTIDFQLAYLDWQASIIERTALEFQAVIQEYKKGGVEHA